MEPYKRPAGQRPLRPGRPVRRLQPQRALGRQPHRRRIGHAALLHQVRRPGDLARAGDRQRHAADRRRGDRPGGPLQRLPAGDPRQGERRPRGQAPAAARRHLHLGHARRVGARLARRSAASTPPTSGTNDYWLYNWFIPKSAQAIEDAYAAQRPAHVHFAEAIEPANMRQCWSSYPYVDDQLMPVLQAVGTDGKADRHARERQPARRDARLQLGRRPRRRGFRPTGRTSSASRSSSATAAWRSRWPGRSAAWRARRCSRARCRACRSATRTATSRPAAGRCSTRAAATPRSATAARRACFGEQLAGAVGNALDTRATRLRARTRSGAHARTSASTSPTRSSRPPPCSACSRTAPRTRRAARRSCRRARRGTRGGHVAEDRGGRVPDRRRRVHVAARRGVPVHLPAQLHGPRRPAQPAVRDAALADAAHERAVPLLRRARRGHDRLHLPARKRRRRAGRGPVEPDAERRRPLRLPPLRRLGGGQLAGGRRARAAAARPARHSTAARRRRSPAAT